jgi:hypothetical protein
MNDRPRLIDELFTRVEVLEQRVSALELHRGTAALSAAQQTTVAQSAATSPPTAAIETGSLFSVLGSAMLGIAGAYLLRAAAQSSVLPGAVAAAIGIPYAIAWVVLAVRTRAGNWLPALVDSATSALILAPMLWELVFRFQILGPSAAAGVVAVYASAGTALAWRRNLLSVIWVANLASVLMALGLFFVSRSCLPFMAVLLLMLSIAAFAESQNRASGLRALNAIAASVAIWAAIYVYISPPSTRPDYPPLAPAGLIAAALGFFAIYLGSVVYNTIVRHRRITAFETILTINGFLLAAVALDAFGPPSALIFFGVLCLALATAAYAAAYLFFDGASSPRNYRVFSTWSVALVLAGGAIALHQTLQATCFGCAAVVASAIGARLNRFALLFHGAAYLAAAAASSGLAVYTFHALAGTLPPAPSWSIYLAFIFVVACYAALPPSGQSSWQAQTVRFFTAFLAICAAASLLAHAFMGLTALRIVPGPHHLAFFRTLSVCLDALALAYAGARFHRVELTRVANVALVLVAVKLVAEDLRHGHLAYIAASIFLFALTLIAVPRVARMARNSQAADRGTMAPPAIPPAGI